MTVTVPRHTVFELFELVMVGDARAARSSRAPMRGNWWAGASTAWTGRGSHQATEGDRPSEPEGRVERRSVMLMVGSKTARRLLLTEIGGT